MPLMSRDTSFDTLTFDLLARLALIQRKIPNVGAAYENIGIQPTPPFPAFFNYVSSYSVDYTKGQSRQDHTITVTTRLLGGSLGSGYQFQQEDAVNKLLTAYINELSFRAHLESPLDDTAFRYVFAGHPVRVGTASSMRGFSYGGADQQGVLLGIEIPIAVTFTVNMPRIG